MSHGSKKIILLPDLDAGGSSRSGRLSPTETRTAISPRQLNLDPAIGAWTEQDQTGYVTGMDLYQIENGNPVSHLDPTGLQTQPGAPATTSPVTQPFVPTKMADFEKPGGIDSKTISRAEYALVLWSQWTALFEKSGVTADDKLGYVVLPTNYTFSAFPGDSKDQPYRPSSIHLTALAHNTTNTALTCDVSAIFGNEKAKPWIPAGHVMINNDKKQQGDSEAHTPIMDKPLLDKIQAAMVAAITVKLKAKHGAGWEVDMKTIRLQADTLQQRMDANDPMLTSQSFPKDPSEYMDDKFVVVGNQK